MRKIENLNTIQLHEALFQGLLGRKLNENEREYLEEFYANKDVCIEELSRNIANSEEFFQKKREDFVYRLFPKSTVVIGHGPMGHELCLDLRQFHMGFATVAGHYEVAESRFVQKHIKPNMTVIDIGGNIGFFTTMFASLVGPSGSVTTFEPVTQTFLRLQAAVHRNRQDHIVKLYHAAASNAEGFAEISYPMDCVNMGGVSITNEGQSRHAIKERIHTVRLDDELGGRQIDFIKIDVEGAELLALQGADQILRSSRPTMMMEFNREQLANVSQTTPEALFELVSGYGYSAWHINWDGDLIPFEGDFSPAVLNLVFLPQ